MTKRKISMQSLLLGSVCLILAACTRTVNTPNDTLVTALSSPIATLDPLFATDANSQHLNQLIHASLIRIGADLVPQPYLAESMRLEGDQKIRFVLRKGCRFHNGKPMDADDVVYSWRVVVDQGNGSPFAAAFSKISKIEKLSPYEIVIHTSEVAPSLLVDLALLKIFPKDGYEKQTFQKSPVGVGPYKVTEFNESEAILDRHNTECLPLAKMPKLIAKTVREDLSRYLKLRNGEIDIVLNDLDYRKVKKAMEEEDGLKAVTGKGVTYSYIGLNFAKKELADIRVRRALAYALDIPKIIQYKLMGMAEPAASVLPDSSFFSNKALKPLPHNLDKAKQLLDQAGYFNGENGKPKLRLSLKTTSNKIIVENAKVIISQLNAAGIEVDHKAYEWGTFYGDVKSRNTEMYLLRWVGGTDPGLLHDIFHSDELERNNRTNYKNELVDKYIDAGQSTLDLTRRKSAYDKVQEITLHELPYIHLWHNRNAAVFRSNVHNVELLPTGAWYTFLNVTKDPTP